VSHQLWRYSSSRFMELATLETRVRKRGWSPRYSTPFLPYPVTDVELIPITGHRTELLLHTYIPLFRLEVTPPSWHKSIQVEISWNNEIGIQKTELLAAYSHTDTRVRQLVMFIKYWAKRRRLSTTTPGHGGMGSFAWSLLCIYFLMKGTHPPVLQNLHSMARRDIDVYAVATAKVHLGTQWLAKS